jgi:hypothetical protein
MGDKLAPMGAKLHKLSPIGTSAAAQQNGQNVAHGQQIGTPGCQMSPMGDSTGSPVKNVANW